MTTQHTPGPWHISKHCRTAINDSSLVAMRHIASTGDHTTNFNFIETMDENEANAEFIVRACNSHYKLLEACRAFIRWNDDTNNGFPDENLLDIAVESARDAIEKATS